jgi:hypothetical protein
MLGKRVDLEKVIVLETQVAVETLKAFINERTKEFWTAEDCVNLISRITE